MCDAYMGCDQEYPFSVKVHRAPQQPNDESAPARCDCMRVRAKHGDCRTFAGEGGVHNWGSTGHREGYCLGEPHSCNGRHVPALSPHLQKCHSEGARVVATDLNAEKLGELKKAVPALVTDTLDVTNSESVEQLLREKYSDTNVLFNCAGYKQYTPS